MRPLAIALLLSVPSLAIAGAIEAPAVPPQAGQDPPGAGVSEPALPREIPLFPLPEVVLFPGVSRPLLIFEPRYREMLADALEGDRVIGMVLLRPGYEKDYDGRPPIHDVGCAGRIVNYEQLPDGRYLIMLRGLTAFRVVSEDHRKAYRQAQVEALPERLRDNERTPLSTLRERIGELLYTVLPLDAEPPDPDLEDAQFVNVVAQNLAMPEGERQELLEHDLISRARAIVARLERK